MAALSRRLGLPVLKFPSPEYREQVSNPGSSCAVYVSNDGKTVMKSALRFHVDGCSPQTTKEYVAFSNESEELLEREKGIYRHLGPHEDLLAYLDVSDNGIVFPFMEYGDLRTFLRNPSNTISDAMKLDWVAAALRGLDFAHSKGVLPADVSARNFLVLDDLAIILCDFSGAAIGDKSNLVYPETRYQMVEGEQLLPVSIATEVFAIGSLIYEISTGRRPYDEEDDETVEALYRARRYPDTGDVLLGSVITGCWLGEFREVADIRHAVSQLNVGSMECLP